ncbi:MAG: glycosyltransferase, partial [Gemmataceae bacterium]
MTPTMKIAYITAGAAGMYCGSCLHDNTLAATLIGMGHDALLIPTYTPITTDEPDVSTPRVFFGGINVYLQERFALFRHTPWFLDRLFNWRPLLRWVSRFAVNTPYETMGALTVSMLQGEHGHQRKEVAKLVHWLQHDVKPEIVNLSNVLLSGAVHEIKQVLKVPVVASLQGDDIFLEALPEPHRTRALDLIRAHCREIDGFLATSNYYAEFMSEYLSIPRDRIHVIHPGLNLTGHGGQKPRDATSSLTVGYFARICPEKGLHVLADALHLLKDARGVPAHRVRISGWLGGKDRPYFEDVKRKLAKGKIAFEHIESPDHAS